MSTHIMISIKYLPLLSLSTLLSVSSSLSYAKTPATTAVSCQAEVVANIDILTSSREYKETVSLANVTTAYTTHEADSLKKAAESAKGALKTCLSAYGQAFASRNTFQQKRLCSNVLSTEKKAFPSFSDFVETKKVLTQIQTTCKQYNNADTILRMKLNVSTRERGILARNLCEDDYIIGNGIRPPEKDIMTIDCDDF